MMTTNIECAQIAQQVHREAIGKLKLLTDNDVRDNRKMLFRVRGALGIATHYMSVEQWQKLTYYEVRHIRMDFEQVLV